MPDRPGELLKLLDLVAEERVNVVDVEHRREGASIDVAETEIWLTLVTRDEEHCDDAAGDDAQLGLRRRAGQLAPQRLNSTVWFPRRSHS